MDIKLGNLGFDESSKNFLRSFVTKIKLEQNENKLIRFFHKHHLTVNTSKTEFTIFDKTKSKDINAQIIIDSIPIDEKPQVKYLRVHIDTNLTFRDEVKHILRKWPEE